MKTPTSDQKRSIGMVARNQAAGGFFEWIKESRELAVQKFKGADGLQACGKAQGEVDALDAIIKTMEDSQH